MRRRVVRSREITRSRSKRPIKDSSSVTIADLFFRVTLPPRSQVASIATDGDELQTGFVNLFGPCGMGQPELCALAVNDSNAPLDVLIVARQISSFGF